MRTAQRIENLPPYLFAEIDRKIAAKKAEGIDVISLGIGDPDMPTPEHIVQRLKEEAARPENHCYPSYYGLPEFRKAAADWYERKYGVVLDPDKEILPLIGSKEGIAHSYTAFLDENSLSLISDPGYPVYQTGALLVGGGTYPMALRRENDFLPDLGSIPAEVVAKAQVMYINYPNNPTAATAGPEFYEEVIAFCKKHGIILCHDFAYAEIGFEGYKAPSLLEFDGGRDTGIEFYSLSKTYNMTGWRIGFAAGNARLIDALGRVKTNIDSGIFNAVQKAGITALEGPQECVAEMCSLYQRRRDKMIDIISKIGWKVERPKASIYLWCETPQGYSSAQFAEFILEKAAVVVSPGNAYGAAGEGYIRLSMTAPDDRIEEALKRIEEAL